MKNIFNGVLAVAVVVLYILHFTQSSDETVVSETASSSVEAAVEGATFPVAYVNLDSLLFSYNLYKDLKKEHEAKYKASEQRFQKQAEQFQKDAYEFQDAAQKGLMTRADAMKKEQELTTRQQELMQLEQNLTQELMIKEEQMQQQIYDSIKVVLDKFNEDKRYRLILNNAFSSNLLDADESLNITDTVLTILNAKHPAE